MKLISTQSLVLGLLIFATDHLLAETAANSARAESQMAWRFWVFPMCAAANCSTAVRPPGATAFPRCITKKARAAGTQIVFASMLAVGQGPR